MNRLSKRKKILNCIDKSVQYNIADGLRILQETARVKFVENVDVAVNLGINPRRSDQNVRNSVVMPHGLGKKIRIAVFTQGESNVILAKRAGADFAGLEDLCQLIKTKGCTGFDVFIASPDVMNIVSQLGPILGPKGLMPNPKMSTVTQNLTDTIRNFKLGQVRYKNDKNGIIHAVIGKVNFNISCLQENLEALVFSIYQVKPTQFKGIYIKKIYISTTMGRSILINKSSLNVLIH